MQAPGSARFNWLKIMVSLADLIQPVVGVKDSLGRFLSFFIKEFFEVRDNHSFTFTADTPIDLECSFADAHLTKGVFLFNYGANAITCTTEEGATFDLPGKSSIDFPYQQVMTVQNETAGANASIFWSYRA